MVFDWIGLERVAGFQASEYAQSTQNKVNEREYASGNRVIKAFVSSEWTFYNSEGCLMTVHSLNDLADPPTKMKHTFRIQKNCQNGQSITFIADDRHLHICPVPAAYQIYLCSKRLGQLVYYPVGIFVNHQGIMRYLTANRIAEVLQSVAKACHPNLSREKIMHFSLHSVRVWAVVLLGEAGMKYNFIKSCLCWMGDLYRLYLQDTKVLQTKHISALERASNDFMMLFGKNLTALQKALPEDNTMGSN